MLGRPDPGEAQYWVFDAATGKARFALPGSPEESYCEFSPDGGLVAILTRANEVRVFRTADGAEVATCREDEPQTLHDLTELSFSPTGRCVIAQNYLGMGLVWEIKSSDLIAALESPGFDSDGDAQHGFVVFDSADRQLFASSSGKTLKVLNIDTREPVKLGSLPGVTSAGFNRDGSRLYTHSEGQGNSLWEAATGRRLVLDQTCPAGAAGWGFKFSPDGRFAAEQVPAGGVRIHDVIAEEPLTPPVGDHELEFECFNAGGSRYVTSDATGSIQLWESPRDPKCVRPWEREGPTSTADDVTFSPNGERIAVLWGGLAKLFECSSEQGRVLDLSANASQPSLRFTADGAKVFLQDYSERIIAVCDAESGKRLPYSLAAVSPGDPVLRLEFSEDLSRVAAYTQAGAALLLDGTSGERITELWPAIEIAPVGAMSADGSLLAVALDRVAWAALWESGGREARCELSGHGAGVGAVGITPDGARVVTGSRDGSAKVWSTADEREIADLPGHGAPVVAVAISPNGARVLSATRDGTVRLWNVARRACVATFSARGGEVASVVFDPKGEIAIAVAGDMVQLARSADGELLRTLECRARITASALSADGTLFATACEDGSATVWRLREAEKLRELSVEAPASCVAFDAQGARLLVAGGSGKCSLFDLASGAELEPLAGHEKPVTGAAFTPNGKRVVTASLDGSVRIWDPAEGREHLRFAENPRPYVALWLVDEGQRIVALTKTGAVCSWNSNPTVRSLEGR